MPPPFSVSAPRAGPQPPRQVAAGAVVALAVLQLCVGITLLALFESYKVYYFSKFLPSWYDHQTKAREAFQEQQQQQAAQAQGGGAGGSDKGAFSPPELSYAPPPGDPHDWRSPMGVVFWLALVSNVFAIAGIAGVSHGFDQLIVAFFAYSAFAVVALAHVFIDMIVESKIDYGAAYGGGGGGGAPPPGPQGDGGGARGPSGYEKAAAALVFVQMIVSGAATLLSLRAADEVRRRKQYKHVSDMASNLAFEPDV